MRFLRSVLTLEVFGLLALLVDAAGAAGSGVRRQRRAVAGAGSAGGGGGARLVRRQAPVPGLCGVGTIECRDGLGLQPVYCCPVEKVCAKGACLAPDAVPVPAPGSANPAVSTIVKQPAETPAATGSSVPSGPTDSAATATPSATSTSAPATTPTGSSAPANNNNNASPVLSPTYIAIIVSGVIGLLLLVLLIFLCARKRKQGKRVLATYEHSDRPSYSRVVVERGNRMSVYSPAGKKIAESTASSSNSSRVSLNVIPATPTAPNVPVPVPAQRAPSPSTRRQSSMNYMQQQQMQQMPMQPTVSRSPSAVSAVSALSTYYPSPLPPNLPLATARGGEDSPTVWDRRPASIYSPVSPIETDPRSLPFASDTPDTSPPMPHPSRTSSTYTYTPTEQPPAVRALTRTMTTGAGGGGRAEELQRPPTSSSCYSFSPPSSRSESRASGYAPYRPGRVSVAYPMQLERGAVGVAVSGEGMGVGMAPVGSYVG